MLQEAIQKIQEMADASRCPSTLRMPGDPDHVSHVVHPDGSIERYVAPPGVRTIEVETIADLTAMAVDPFDPLVRADIGRQIITFAPKLAGAAGGEVRLWFDCGLMRDSAYVRLKPTHEMSLFLTKVHNPYFEVHDMRDALRLVLRKCFNDPRLIEQVSSLAFTDTDKAAVEAQRGRASMSAAVQKQVQEPEQLPDEHQTFNVRRWANPDLDVRHRLDCILDPDARSRRWFFKPIEDSLIEFERMSCAHLRTVIHEGLGDAPVKVYQGAGRIRPSFAGGVPLDQDEE